MIDNYIDVNILKEFKELNDIDKLNQYLLKNDWELVKIKKNEEMFYQLFFGKEVQTDNKLEYGVDHLLNKKDVYNELQRLANYIIGQEITNTFEKIKKYCASFENFNIYSYLYYIGLTKIKEDISKEDLSVLIEKCSELGGEYTDPIELGKSLANEIYQKNNVSIDDIKSLKIDEFYNWYNDGREIGNSLEIESLDEREVN